jgi:acyl-CoA synthetase (NDP forming)
MVASLRSYPLLEGFRGTPRADLAALEDVLLRVGALVEAHPEVAEMDCNPVVVSASGAVIVDARVRVEQAAPPGPSPTV